MQVNFTFSVDVTVDFSKNPALLRKLRKFTLETFLGVNSETELDERWAKPEAFREDALEFLSAEYMPQVVHYDMRGHDPMISLKIDGAGVSMEVVEALIPAGAPRPEMYV